MLFRTLVIVALVSALFVAPASAQTNQVVASGVLNAASTINCMTSQWMVGGNFSAGTTGVQFLVQFQALLVANPNFIAAGGSASIQGNNLIINPGSDPNVMFQCGVDPFVPLNGASCNGLSFAVNAIPTLSEWGMIGIVVLLLGAGTFYIVRRRRAAPLA